MARVRLHEYELHKTRIVWSEAFKTLKTVIDTVGRRVNGV